MRGLPSPQSKQRERQASRGLRATALDRGVHVQCGHSREPIPVSGPHEAQQPQEKGWLDHTCDKHHSWCEAPGGAERQEGAWSAQSRGASYVEVLEPHSPGGWSGFTPAEATPQELSLSGVRVNLSGSGRPGKVAQANSPHQGSVWPWLREVTAMAARGGGSWAHPTARPRTSRDWKNRPSKRLEKSTIKTRCPLGSPAQGGGVTCPADGVQEDCSQSGQ